MKKYHNIQIDPSKDNQLSARSKILLNDYYLKHDETPQEGFARAALAYCDNDFELAQRIYDYASKGWFMYASPVLSNAPKPNEPFKSLPISCFLTYVEDTVAGLINNSIETRWMSISGGGVGSHWSSVRPVSKQIKGKKGKAPGVIPWLKTIDSDVLAYNQGGTRRGSCAVYMDISHPDIDEFISMRVPTGDANRKCLNLHNAVNVTDKFFKALFAEDDSWDLIDPHNNEVRETVSARELFEKILTIRYRTGEPYINYIDEANRHLPLALKHAGLKIQGSNLCNEIHLPTNKDRSAVCCLSSLNLEKWEEWKDTTIVEDLIVFLDNVLQIFIDNAPDTLSKAKLSAISERSLGLGAMGFHYLLMSKNLPFASQGAKDLNTTIFKTIKEKAIQSSKNIAFTKGCYPDLQKYIDHEKFYQGMNTESTSRLRNAHLLAIAPNANNSMILDTSATIEPIVGNAYGHKTKLGTDLVKNKYLEKLLKLYGKNDKQTWDSIIANNGSVQQLDFLSNSEKEIFLTADEIDQCEVINQARLRQEYICQGQSVNLFFPPETDSTKLLKVHLHAFNPKGVGKPLKGLYYLRTQTLHQTEKLSEKITQEKLNNYVPPKNSEISCVGCEG